MQDFVHWQTGCGAAFGPKEALELSLFLEESSCLLQSTLLQRCDSPQAQLSCRRYT